MTEAAVMIAFALHLIDGGATDVEIHPDGEHGKKFDIKACLESNGFQLTEGIGSTDYGGRYRNGQRSIIVTPVPGAGDVVARTGGRAILAECKGGIINTRHSGQTSKLRRGLCEAVGLLLARPFDGERQIAVVPATQITEKLARRMASRAGVAGIEIGLVTEDGRVSFIT
jgi:hypothetical protein